VNNKLFYSQTLNDDFDKNGFVKLPLSPDCDLDSLLTEINTLQPEDKFLANQKSSLHNPTFHATFFDLCDSYRIDVLKIVQSFFKSFLGGNISGYKIVMGNIFIKPPYTGEVSTHQNMTLIDETKHTSISLWCPLIDTFFENGTMCVVPGTHKKLVKYRSDIIPWPLQWYYEQEGKKDFVPIHVKKGEVIVLDDSLVHYTPINSTEHSRIVLHAIAIPKDAELLYFKKDVALKVVNKYVVDELFWQLHKPGSSPDFHLISSTLPDTDLQFNYGDYSFKRLISG
jgi:hypothetical protein